MSDPITEHCREVIEAGSKSFARAASLLDPTIRGGAYQLYAYCRHCDDVIDGQTMGHAQELPDQTTQERRLAELRETTDRALRGEAVDGLVFQAIARVVRRHEIPERHVREFLDGMGMDVTGNRYRTFEQMQVYCYHVAGVVGVMMAHIMNIKDDATLGRARDLGTAMQVTNISRDVMDDALVGRVYLPLDWLEEAGLPTTAAAVADPANRRAVAGVVKRMLDRADSDYQSADTGIAHLAFRSAWSIAAARWIYSDIGNVIRRRGVEAWDSRSRTGSWRKVWWLSVALGRTVAGRFRS